MSHRDTKTKHDKPYIENIRIRHVVDENPELSYLEQEYKDCTPEENEKYKKQDKERLDNYGTTWYQMGIYVEADILVPKGDNVVQIIPIKSGGLWGIDSDNDPEEFEHIEAEEIRDIKDTLAQLNIEVPKDVEIKGAEQ
jgi:hypothetical protein